MTQRDLSEINWTAVFIGFGVDLMFTELVGLVVMAVMLSLKGIGLDSEEVLPPDVILVRQIVGVLGAVVGGLVAGYLARQRGRLHGLLGSVAGLILFFCSFLILGGASLDVGDLGFIVLNLVGAWYGGGMGENWRARRAGER